MRHKQKVYDVKFDPGARKEYITGFGKRKAQRRKNFQEKTNEEVKKELRSRRYERKVGFYEEVRRQKEMIKEQEQAELSDNEENITEQAFSHPERATTVVQKRVINQDMGVWSSDEEDEVEIESNEVESEPESEEEEQEVIPEDESENESENEYDDFRSHSIGFSFVHLFNFLRECDGVLHSE
ncbi:hypothetical protein PCE1_002854 [Barthelona sp. PCE]